MYHFAANININPNLPGTNDTSTITGVIQNFYSFALMVAGILAFGAIVWGGIKYATGHGNPSAESEGRSWITGALLGLLLLAGASVILYTVNPQLVNLSPLTLPGLNAPQDNGGGGGGGGGGNNPPMKWGCVSLTTKEIACADTQSQCQAIQDAACQPTPACYQVQSKCCGVKYGTNGC